MDNSPLESGSAEWLELLGPLSGPTRNWLEYWESTNTLVMITQYGVEWALRMPTILDSLRASSEALGLGDLHGMATDSADDRLKNAKREADLGFPHLYAHSLMGLWGALDCFIEDCVVAVLLDTPLTLDLGRFGRSKVPLDVALDPDPGNRTRQILHEIRNQQNRTSEKRQEGQLWVPFESTLAIGKLSGPIPLTVRKSLHHVRHIRNVWAHHGGRVDDQMLVACPDLPWKTRGDLVAVSAELAQHLANGMFVYGLVVINRWLAARGSAAVVIEVDGYPV